MVKGEGVGMAGCNEKEPSKGKAGEGGGEEGGEGNGKERNGRVKLHVRFIISHLQKCGIFSNKKQTKKYDFFCRNAVEPSN